MDDFSVPPVAPSFIPEPELEDDVEALQEDQEKAKAYFHPAWAKVEEMFDKRCEELERISAIDQKLNAEEFAIKAKANLAAAQIVKTIWIEVKNAVTAVSERERK